MSKVLDDLIAQVERNTTVSTSAVVLIKGLADQIAASAGDPVKIAELTTQLSASADSLAAAVVANTPAAPPAA